MCEGVYVRVCVCEGVYVRMCVCAHVTVMFVCEYTCDIVGE